MVESFAPNGPKGNNRVVVTGLRETNNAIKRMEDGASKLLRDAMKRVALIVVEDARKHVPRRKGKAQASIRPRGGVKGVGIAMGGASAPYMPWLDFGGTVGKGHRPGRPMSGSVYRTWLGRPAGKGRYLYPAIEENIDEVQEAFVSELNGLLSQYGMTVEGGVE